jgi:hypothetical protein
MIRSLQDWILELPNVTKASHRFRGTEFQVHGLEFMHTHGTSHLDIRLSKEDQERILKEGKASRIALLKPDGSPLEFVRKEILRPRKN